MNLSLRGGWACMRYVCIPRYPCVLITGPADNSLHRVHGHRLWGIISRKIVWLSKVTVGQNISHLTPYDCFADLHESQNPTFSRWKNRNPSIEKKNSHACVFVVHLTLNQLCVTCTSCAMYVSVCWINVCIVQDNVLFPFPTWTYKNGSPCDHWWQIQIARNRNTAWVIHLWSLRRFGGEGLLWGGWRIMGSRGFSGVGYEVGLLKEH
jgi:hypothetical protein